MSNMQASVRALAQNATSPAEMCRQLNRVVLENTRSGRFTTFFYGIFDTPGTLRYTNAGHVPPLLVGHDGSISRLTSGGTVLGIFAGASYDEGQIALERGDRLVLVTDGITEAANSKHEEFGEDRLIRLLLGNRQRSAGELQRILWDAVASFTGRPLQDDATLMIVSMR